MKEWRSDIYGRSLSEKGRKKMKKVRFRDENIKNKGRRVSSKNAFGKVLRNIKRPVLWIALFTVGLVFTMLDTAEKRLDIPRLSSVSGEVSGTVCDIEFKNQKTYLYLKNIEFISVDLKDFKNIKSSSFLCSNMGMVCILKDGQEVEVPVLSVQAGKPQKDADNNLYSNENTAFYIGSKITVRGKINVYNKATNPGEFDMRRYYISKGYLFNASSCEVIASDSKRNILSDTSYRISSKIGGLIDRSLNAKDAGMIKAILLADKTDLDRETKDLYKDAGASHLLAISGLHISMFAAFILFLLKKTPLNLKAAYIITVVLLFTYGFLIGFSASALRATVMFTILCIGRMFHKTYDSLNSLSAALLITILIKPLYVLQNGFLMSYLAIIAIAVVLPIFAVIGKKSGKVISSLTMSTSVTMTTLPVVVNSYYRIPLYSPLLNVILVPGMTILLTMGILCILVRALIESPIYTSMCCWLLNSSIISGGTYEFLYSGRINIFAVGIHFFLMIYEWLMKAELMLPSAIITTGARSAIRGIIYEVILLGVSVFIRKAKLSVWRKQKVIINRDRRELSYNPTTDIRDLKKRKVALLIFSIIALTLNLTCFLVCYRKNKIDFLDVGQGLCVCVQYNGQVYCYDGGSTDRKDIYEYVIAPYFAYYGISEVEAWFISHEDADHTSGIKALLEEDSITAKEIIIPRILEDKFASIKSLADSAGTKIIYSSAGDVFKDRKKHISFSVLSPSPGFPTDDSNACSLVVLMQTKNENVLLMGDSGTMAEERVLEYLNNSNPIQTDILQVAHHGSANNTNSEAFLGTIKPRVSVISCGFDNSYGHPHVETLEALGQTDSIVFRTDENGYVSYFLE